MSITKYEVFSIDSSTRFLIIEREDGSEEVITSLAGNKEHQKIYKELATDMWGASSVGHGDLLEGLM
jgi:hypothetical protein|tara:strand:+ start:1033 stop:1233 length:201 start_codon:yes stop_codon:yes gene_type:complete